MTRVGGFSNLEPSILGNQPLFFSLVEPALEKECRIQLGHNFFDPLEVDEHPPFRSNELKLEVANSFFPIDERGQTEGVPLKDKGMADEPNGVPHQKGSLTLIGCGNDFQVCSYPRHRAVFSHSKENLTHHFLVYFFSRKCNT